MSKEECRQKLYEYGKLFIAVASATYELAAAAYLCSNEKNCGTSHIGM